MVGANPDMSASHIADRCDCSTSYVRTTLKKYGNNGQIGRAHV